MYILQATFFTTIGVKKFFFAKASVISSFELTNGKIVFSSSPWSPIFI